MGRIGEARKLLGAMLERAKDSYVSPSSIATVFIGLGEIARAFDWFERAVEERDGMVHQFLVSPVCDPLRSDPRYHALLRKMNLEALTGEEEDSS